MTGSARVNDRAAIADGGAGALARGAKGYSGVT